ncbi:hypothetical protein BJ085DRAFT_37450 [Dimargaris cristalligena]|uniref:PAS domain-containing protein n=1 Tax=Dimargaris cristalligena TaxID=215637 RepID=A0A4P9ZQS8_9FUNG|nr:hypothetical protein BJ085DRAFT_37450 [Dimargaris cristalligena]|eukprot:RKP35727.1 hypothetical protein BJ085DRAFT_37450 [Dimargaris cristalligena]
MGKTATCVDVQHKKRGRPKLKDRKGVMDGPVGTSCINPSIMVAPIAPLTSRTHDPMVHHINQFSLAGNREHHYRYQPHTPTAGPVYSSQSQTSPLVASHAIPAIREIAPAGPRSSQAYCSVPGSAPFAPVAFRNDPPLYGFASRAPEPSLHSAPAFPYNSSTRSSSGPGSSSGFRPINPSATITTKPASPFGVYAPSPPLEGNQPKYASPTLASGHRPYPVATVSPHPNSGPDRSLPPLSSHLVEDSMRGVIGGHRDVQSHPHHERAATLPRILPPPSTGHPTALPSDLPESIPESFVTKEVVVIMSMDYVSLRVTDNCAAILGHTPPEFLERPLTDFLYQDDIPLFLKLRQILLDQLVLSEPATQPHSAHIPPIYPMQPPQSAFVAMAPPGGVRRPPAGSPRSDSAVSIPPVSGFYATPISEGSATSTVACEGGYFSPYTPYRAQEGLRSTISQLSAHTLQTADFYRMPLTSLMVMAKRSSSTQDRMYFRKPDGGGYSLFNVRLHLGGGLGAECNRSDTYPRLYLTCHISPFEFDSLLDPRAAGTYDPLRSLAGLSHTPSLTNLIHSASMENKTKAIPGQLLGTVGSPGIVPIPGMGPGRLRPEPSEGLARLGDALEVVRVRDRRRSSPLAEISNTYKPPRVTPVTQLEAYRMVSSPILPSLGRADDRRFPLVLPPPIQLTSGGGSAVRPRPFSGEAAGLPTRPSASPNMRYNPYPQPPTPHRQPLHSPLLVGPGIADTYLSDRTAFGSPFQELAVDSDSQLKRSPQLTNNSPTGMHWRTLPSLAPPVSREQIESSAPTVAFLLGLRSEGQGALDVKSSDWPEPKPGLPPPS